MNDNQIIATIIEILTTSVLSVFLGYRLAVYGKKENGVPYWKSVTMMIAGNIWAQFAFTVWQPNNTALKIVKYATVATLLLPTVFVWFLFAVFTTGFFDGFLFG